MRPRERPRERGEKGERKGVGDKDKNKKREIYEIIGDGEYKKLTYKRWYGYHKEWMKILNKRDMMNPPLPSYQEETYDCEDYSLEYMLYIKKRVAQDKIMVGSSPMVYSVWGEFDIIKGRHAINKVVLDPNNHMKLSTIYVEPQTGECYYPSIVQYIDVIIG